MWADLNNPKKASEPVATKSFTAVRSKRHKSTGAYCLVMHYDGKGQCWGCSCGDYHRPGDKL